MSKRHITTTRDRQSRKYKARHRQLKADVEADGRIRSLRHLDDAQKYKWSRSELFRLYGETSP